MSTRDCHLCQSAGSVNIWGVCEVCGEYAAVEGAASDNWQEEPAACEFPPAASGAIASIECVPASRESHGRRHAVKS